MRIDTLSIFPEMIEQTLNYSIPAKAQAKGLLKIAHVNIRDYATDKHSKVDDIPYGGGVGMVFKPEPVAAALRAIAQTEALVIHPSPAAPKLTQEDVIQLSTHSHLVFIASRYEGLDQRIIERYVDREYSIGDFVISGGELACSIMIDAIIRVLPGAISKEESFQEDSFYNGSLDYPHYTRPANFEGMEVPKVLLSGHHKNIRDWRRAQALERTRRFRPDLLPAKQKK